MLAARQGLLPAGRPEQNYRAPAWPLVLRTGEDRRERLLDKAISEISTSSGQNLPSIFFVASLHAASLLVHLLRHRPWGSRCGC